MKVLVGIGGICSDSYKVYEGVGIDTGLNLDFAGKFCGVRRFESLPTVRNIERVIFNGPATIVFWPDGTKTVVKCDENDPWDPEVGILLCIIKKNMFHNDSRAFNKYLKRNVYPYSEGELTDD